MASAFEEQDQPVCPDLGKMAGNSYMLRNTDGSIGDEPTKLLQHVLGLGEGQEHSGQAEHSSCRADISFGKLEAFLDSTLENCVKDVEEPDGEGRLGCGDVHFDITGNSGTMIIEADRLGVKSHSNFSTIRANTCVYKGKWQFELMLGSKGVMQLGWCTRTCKFSQEEGVGDTKDSYAYDGNRVRKWNTTTMKYGQPWLTGDVITCGIDCDNGTIVYGRNGVNMGLAFSHVKFGPGIAYFPAVSLSMGENLRANFGTTPFRFPLEGYRPLQDRPEKLITKAAWLFGCLDRWFPLLLQEDRRREKLIEDPLGVSTMAEQQGGRSHRASLTLTAAHLFDKLAELLQNSYIVEANLLRMMLRYTEPYPAEQTAVHKLLDVLWMFLQEGELKSCLEHLVKSLLNLYRFSLAKPSFQEQEAYLTLTLGLLQHDRTRKHLIKYIIFDKIKFPIFLHVKPLDDEGFTDVIRTPWWGFVKKEEDKTECDERKKREYLSACEKLHERTKALEDIQVEMMKTLLINTDSSQEEASTRFVFLHKLREFLKENSVTGVRSTFVNMCALPVSLCFFHRLVQAVRFYWDQEALHNQAAISSSEAYVPCEVFFGDTINYFDTHRAGGLYSHLKKTTRADLFRVQGDTVPAAVEAEVPLAGCSTDGKGEGDIRRVDRSGASSSLLQPAVEQGHQLDASLVEMVDGVIMLYNIAAHKQLGKMCTLRDGLKDFVHGLEDAERKLAKCPPELPDVRVELERARDVFLEKATEQTRHMAWVISVIYAKDKQEDVYWLLCTVLRSLQRASECGSLFAFVPDFYVDVAISSYNALRSYFHPTVSYQTLPDFDKCLRDFAEFLCEHFADPRIVNADIKDSLVQALACFVCYPQSLAALEAIPRHSQEKMIKALMAPYENRSWAQTNWILVRLWKGCGFGFRYVHLPHLVPVKHQQQEMGTASLQEPCPSAVFQRLMADIMHHDEEAATKLIDSLLKQLNWAFSEFIGMLQEIQSIASQAEQRYIDSRQLKICATCFDISVGLMRVLEMVVSLAPELITDFSSRPSAELLLSRLFQCVCQVLNRVTARQNLFEMVVNLSMPGLETVDHFPILTAMAGILVRLVGSDDTKAVATQALLSEPSFQPSSLDFLVGGTTDTAGATAVPKDRRIFTFRKYKEINKEEVGQVEDMISHLQREQQALITHHAMDIPEDSLCNICYARPKSVMFQPCQHESCKPCIQHHMMTKKQCFFCMATITSVTDKHGNPIRLV